MLYGIQLPYYDHLLLPSPGYFRQDRFWHPGRSQRRQRRYQPDEPRTHGPFAPEKGGRHQKSQEDLVGQGNGPRSFYPPAFHDDRGRHFSDPGVNGALRPVRPETAKEPAPHHQRRDHPSTGRRNLQRIDRETSARF